MYVYVCICSTYVSVYVHECMYCHIGIYIASHILIYSYSYVLCCVVLCCDVSAFPKKKPKPKPKRKPVKRMRMPRFLICYICGR